MFWIFVLLFFLVIGAKYYTAIGSRNLERRLNRVKSALEGARKRLREERERQSAIAVDMELAELRVRYMKELIMDLGLRQSRPAPDEKVLRDEAVAAAVMRF